MANTKKDKTWLWVVLIALAVIFVLYLVNSIRTVTYYIADQKPSDLKDISDALSDEERAYYENRMMFEVNYFSNADKSGTYLYEFKMDFFTDETLSTQACRSAGMQYVGKNYSDITQNIYIEEKDYLPEHKNLFYYNTTLTNGDIVSWDGSGKVATNLTRETKFIVKIDNKPYLMQMTGYENKLKVLGVEVFNDYYTFGTLFVDCMNAVKKNSKSNGDFYITIDISKYFKLYPYDEFSKSWINTNVAKQVLSFSTLKFHHHDIGATTNDDSLFGIIKNNNEFDIRPYTINFFENKTNNEEPISFKLPYDTKNIYLPNPNFEPNEGYIFSNYFNTQPNGTGDSYTFGLIDMERGQVLNLYAQWVQKPIKVWLQDTASGQDICQEFFAGQTQNLQLNTFVRDGFKFVGWNTQRDGSGTSYSDGQSIFFEEYRNVFYLYAQWELITAEPVAVAVGDNLRGKTLEIEIYSHSGDGWTLFSFEDRSQGYIKTLDADPDIENICGYEGFGIFAGLYRNDEGSEVIILQIPDDADYIVSYINYDYGVNYALYY